LNHDNIVKLVDYSNTQNNHGKSQEQEADVQYIAMEYINGVELIEFLMCKGHLKENVARHVFKKLLNGIKHIHDSGLVHRDIKSDNIMITDFCNPKIVDFGFAADVHAEDRNGFFTQKVGTPAYMAPELLAGAPYKGTEVDIFALGIVLFQMVVGHPPFESATDNDLLYKCVKCNRSEIFWRKHLRSAAKDVVLNEKFKDLIFRMLQLDPKNRPSLDEIIADGWVQLGEDPTEDELMSEFKERIALIRQA